MKNAKLSCTLLALVFALTAHAGAQAQVIQESDVPPKIDAELDAKVNALSPQETVRVVVQFEVPADRAGAMRRGAADADRRSAVAEARRDMFNSLPAAANMRADIEANMKRSFSYLPYVAIETSPAQIAALANSPHVTRIYEDRTMRAFLPESTGISLVDAFTTRSLGFEGQGQTIAILDNGIAKSHSFIAANRFVAEACYANGCPFETGPGAGEPQAGTTDFHGMHVAGIAAGSDTITFSGVAPKADVMSVRVLDADGTGSFSNAVAGLEFVYDNRSNFDIASVNMSLGILGLPFTQTCDDFDPAMTDAIDLLSQAGIAVVVASGNDGFTDAISSPACISSAISVGSSIDASDPLPICNDFLGGDNTIFDAVSTFSNSAEILDLLAPGSTIESSDGTGTSFCNRRGTSMAAPHVAGAFAVLKSEVPAATTQDILDALIATGKQITDAKNPAITKPRIDVYEALLCLRDDVCAQTAFAVVPLNEFTIIPINN